MPFSSPNSDYGPTYDPVAAGNPLGDEETVGRMKLIQKWVRSGDLPPGAALALASDPATDDDELYATVGRAIGFGKAVRVAQRFRNLDRQDALSDHGMSLQREWDEMDPIRQKYLRDLGVKPPAERWTKLAKRYDQGAEDDDSGFDFGDLVGTPLDLLGDGVGAVKDVAGAGLHAMEVGFGAIPHLYRALQYGDEMAGGSEGGELFTGHSGGFGWLFDLDKVSDAWERTGEAGGEKSYLPSVHREAHEIAGKPLNYQVALDMSVPGNEDPTAGAERYAAKVSGLPEGSPLAPGNQKYNQAYNRYLSAANEPGTRKATRLFLQNKMSMGRDIARTFGLENQNSMAFNLVSGTADMLIGIYMDPTIIGGKFHKGFQAGRYAIEGASALQKGDEIARLGYWFGSGRKLWDGFDVAGRYAHKMNQAVDAATLDQRIVGRGFSDLAAVFDNPSLRRTYLKEMKHLSPVERRIAMIYDAYNGAPEDAAKRMGAFVDLMGPEGIKMIPVIDDTAKRFMVANTTFEQSGLMASLDELEQMGQGAHGTIGGIELTGNLDDDIAALAKDTQLALRGKTHAWRNPTDVFKWMRDDPAAVAAITKGEWSQHLHGYTSLPKLTQSGMLRLRMKLGTQEKIWDWAKFGDRVDSAFEEILTHADSDVDAMSRLAMNPRIMAGERHLAHVWGGIGKGLRSLTKQLPKNARALPLTGQEAVVELDKWLATGMFTRKEHQLMLGQILAAESIPAKRAAMTHAMGQVFDSLGVRRDGGSWGAEMMFRMAGEHGTQYSPAEGLSRVRGALGDMHAAIYPSQVADDYFPIPAFSEVMQNIDQMNGFRALRDGAGRASLNGEHSLLDAGMTRVWKPWMVLRLGFIPRAYLDEALPWIARAGQSASIKTGLVYPTVMESASHPVAWYMRPLAAIERRIRNADYAADFAQRWQETLEGAAEGLEHGAIPELTTRGQRLLSETADALYKADAPNVDALVQMGGHFTVKDGKLVVNRKVRQAAGYRGTVEVVDPGVGLARRLGRKKGGGQFFGGGSGITVDGIAVNSLSDARNYDELVVKELGLKMSRGKVMTEDGIAITADELREIKRAFGYSDADAMMTRYLQAHIRRVVLRHMDVADIAHLKQIARNPAAQRTVMEEIAGPDSFISETEEIRRSGVGGIVTVQDGRGQVKTIRLRKRGHGERLFDPGAGMTDPAVLNGLEHTYGSVANDMTFQAGVGQLYVDPMDGLEIAQRANIAAAGYDPGDYATFIDDVREDFTALSGTQRRILNDVVRARTKEAHDFHLAHFIEVSGHQDTALAHVLAEWDNLTDAQRGTMFLRKDQFFDGVGGRGTRLGLPWEKAGKITRAEFRADYARNVGIVEHGTQVGVTTPEVAEAQRWLDEIKSDPGFAEAVALRDGKDDFVDELYDQLVNTGHKRILDENRSLPAIPISDEAVVRREELVKRALMDPSADKQLRTERILEAIRDPRVRVQRSKMDTDLFHAIDGRRAARPVPKDHSRYYGLLLTDDDAHKVAQFLEQHPFNEEGAQGLLSGFKALRGGAGKRVDEIPKGLDHGAQYNLFSANITNDPEELRRITELLVERVGLDRSRVAFGQVDLANSMTREMHAASARAGLSPTQVVAPLEYASGRKWFFEPDFDALRKVDGQWMLGATQEEIEQGMAERILADVEARMRGKHGKWNSTVASTVHNGDYHPSDALRAGEELWPAQVYGPDLYLLRENPVDMMVRFGFDRVIAPALAAMIRQPMMQDRAVVAMRLMKRELEPRLIDAGMREMAAGHARALGLQNDTDLYERLRAMYDRVHERRDLTGTLAQRLDGLLAEVGAGLRPELDHGLLQWADDAGILTGELAPLKQVASMAPTDLARLNRWYIKEVDVERQVVEASMMRAFNDVMPFIDDHRVRSQAATHLKNLMPFWFAQEQFYKRVARTVMYDPTAIHKLQLTMHGLEAMGVTQKDEYGEDVFIYPGTALTHTALNRMSDFLGADASIPFSVPLTGQVKYASPGFADIGIPSAGPALSIPIGALANQFPWMRGAEEAIVGERGMDRSLVEQLFPASITRFLTAVTADADSDRQFASIQHAVLQHMEAAASRYDRLLDEANFELINTTSEKRRAELGEKIQTLQTERNRIGVPGEGATAEEIAAWMERTHNWTTNLMVLKAVVGFSGPAAPTADMSGEGISDLEAWWEEKLSADDEVELGKMEGVDVGDVFRRLLKSLPVDQAVTQLMERYPDARPYTIFGTKTESGASIPATEAGFQWVDENQEFLNTYKMAGPWLAPSQAQNGEYFAEAYNQQLAMHMRERLGPEEQWREMQFAKAAEPYFRMRDDYEQQRMALGDEAETLEERRHLDAQWAAASKAFLRQHPIFAEKLRSPRAALERQQIIDELHGASLASDAPETARDPRLRTLLNRWDDFKARSEVLSYGRTAKDQDARERLRKDFFTWGQRYTEEHPEYVSLWLRVFRPEIGLDNAELDAMEVRGRGLPATIRQTPERVRDTDVEARRYAGPTFSEME